MKIKTPTINDAENISTLLRDNFRDVNSADYKPEHIQAWIDLDSPERIKEVIENKDVRSFLALDQDEIVGFLALSTQEAVLNSLYVKPSKTGQGIGSELLEFAEDLLKSHKKAQITLNSSKTAKKFYQKRGYQEIHDLNLLINNTKIPVIKMVKDL